MKISENFFRKSILTDIRWQYIMLYYAHDRKDDATL